MTRSTDNGGPAFPPMHDPETHAFGMTLRDYFAAKAMHALISMDSEGDDHYDDETNQYVSVRSYMIADAMLKARTATSDSGEPGP